MDNIVKFFTQKEVYGLLIIIVLCFIINKIFNFLADQLLIHTKDEFDKKKRTTVINLIKNIAKYAVVIIGVIIALDLYGFNVSGLIASLGVASAVAALALQDTLKDIVSGATIILENYYIVGDYVKYKNFTGQIIHLGLKTTKIMDFDGQVITVANRNIDEIINLSQKTASCLITIPTSYDAKIPEVEKVIDEIVEEIKKWPTMDNKKTSYIGILDLGESSVDYGIRLYCSPGKVWQYKRDALRLVKIKYDEYNITIPYKQIEVHNAKK